MMTGIPVMRMVEAETDKLRRMGEDLKGAVVGQEDAIMKVVKLYPAQPRWSERPAKADWLLHLPRPYGRR